MQTRYVDHMSVYPGALCFTSLHKYLHIVKGCLQMIAQSAQVSLSGNVVHCVGRLVCLFWAYVCPLAAFLLTNMVETSHWLLSQWVCPTSAHLLTRKGTGGIGEALLNDVVLWRATQPTFSKEWEVKTWVPIIVSWMRPVDG